jgi:hypothetical protein
MRRSSQVFGDRFKLALEIETHLGMTFLGGEIVGERFAARHCYSKLSWVFTLWLRYRQEPWQSPVAIWHFLAI